MIIFYGEGRLGNQVFQYQALSHIAKLSEAIMAIGLEELQQVFELRGPKLLILTKSLLVKRIAKYLFIPLLVRPLARTLRLINYAMESTGGTHPHTGATGEIQLQRGLINCITFVDGGYYQNSILWKEPFPAKLFHLKEELRSAANNYLTSVITEDAKPIFVHVRRGDYLGYGSYGLTNFSLPAEYYRRAMQALSEQFERVHFVFVTDDAPWVADTFNDVINKSIASFSAKMDFAIMAACRSGVLSNSTFSLAAAFMLDSPETVIAPRYWFGFRVGEWYPPRIQVMHDKVNYIPVLASLEST